MFSLPETDAAYLEILMYSAMCVNELPAHARFIHFIWPTVLLPTAPNHLNRQDCMARSLALDEILYAKSGICCSQRFALHTCSIISIFCRCLLLLGVLGVYQETPRVL